ncbi:hypothetical protein ES708_17739 [subsurface metagenome]
MKGKNIPFDFNSLRRPVMTALPLTKLSGRDFRIIILILNQTDAYQRLEDKIKPAFFVERTGLDKSNTRVAIARLRNWKMIVKSGLSYSVLPPDQWDKAVFWDKADFAEQEKRIKSNALLELEPGPNRIKSDAPTASNPMHPELKIDALLGTPIENPSIENFIEKKTASFEEYKNQLRERFADLDFDIELEKFDHYWSEGTRKLQRPKFALLNWMTRARKFKAEEASPGVAALTTTGSSPSLLITASVSTGSRIVPWPPRLPSNLDILFSRLSLIALTFHRPGRAR